MTERTHTSDRAELRAISPHASAIARRTLIAWASYLCLQQSLSSDAQREIIRAMAPALRDLRTVADGPIYQVRMAADALVEGVEAGRPFGHQARLPLARALQAYFLSNIENAA